MGAHAVAFAHDRLDMVDEGENVGFDADLFGETLREAAARAPAVRSGRGRRGTPPSRRRGSAGSDRVGRPRRVALV
jgi:hypothetical protein